jgi:uncharacterized protein YjiS (DUF1127 family)
MTTCQGSINTVASRGTAPAGFSAWIDRVGHTLAIWSERYQRRQELRDLLNRPEHLLRDMGITREAVYREYRKPFWRA